MELVPLFQIHENNKSSAVKTQVWQLAECTSDRFTETQPHDQRKLTHHNRTRHDKTWILIIATPLSLSLCSRLQGFITDPICRGNVVSWFDWTTSFVNELKPPVHRQHTRNNSPHQNHQTCMCPMKLLDQSICPVLDYTYTKWPFQILVKSKWINSVIYFTQVCMFVYKLWTIYFYTGSKVPHSLLQSVNEVQYS